METEFSFAGFDDIISPSQSARVTCDAISRLVTQQHPSTNDISPHVPASSAPSSCPRSCDTPLVRAPIKRILGDTDFESHEAVVLKRIHLTETSGSSSRCSPSVQDDLCSPQSPLSQIGAVRTSTQTDSSTSHVQRGTPMSTLNSSSALFLETEVVSSGIRSPSTSRDAGFSDFDDDNEFDEDLAAFMDHIDPSVGSSFRKDHTTTQSISPTSSCQVLQNHSCILQGKQENELDSLRSRIAQQLDSDQYSAATSFPDEPLILFACAGSGKTKTMLWRIGYLLSCNVPPDRLLAMTFSRRACQELISRLRSELQYSNSSRLRVYTFHSYAYSLVHQFYERLGYSSSPQVAQRGDLLEIIEEAILRFSHTVSNCSVGSLSDLSNDRSRFLNFIQKRIGSGNPPDDREHAEIKFVYEYYISEMKRRCIVDFPSMVSLGVTLLQSDQKIRETISCRYSHILVDEFQDTSEQQLELLRLLSPLGHITVVGDDDQAIYSFRGSCSDVFSRFKEIYSSFRITENNLEMNYRSRGPIVAAASKLISMNKNRAPKELRVPPTKNGGQCVHLRVFENPEQEVAEVISSVSSLHAKGVKWSDIAILCRCRRNVLPDFEDSCRLSSIPISRKPSVVVSRLEARHIMSYLSLVVNEADDSCFFRVCNVPARQIGPNAQEYLATIARQFRLPVMECVRGCLDRQSFPQLPGKKKLSSPARRGLADFVSLIDFLKNASQTSSPLQLIRMLLDKSSIENSWKQQHQKQQNQGNSGHSPGRKPAIKKSSSPKSFSATSSFWGIDNDVVEALEEEDALSEFLSAAEHVLSQVHESLLLEVTNSSLVPVEFHDLTGMDVLELFVREFAFASDDSESEQQQNSVTVATIHQAKGLQWKIVFLVRMNEGVCPVVAGSERNRSSFDSSFSAPPSSWMASLEEERRLAYVGVTRAEDTLYLCGVCSPELVGKESSSSSSVPGAVRGDSGMSHGVRILGRTVSTLVPLSEKYVARSGVNIPIVPTRWKLSRFLVEIGGDLIDVVEPGFDVSRWKWKRKDDRNEDTTNESVQNRGKISTPFQSASSLCCR